MRRGLKVVVGENWADEVEVVGQESEKDEATASKARTRVAHSMALGAGLLIAAFAGYGMVRADSALIDRIFNLVEWVLIWLLGWAVGRSH